MEMEIEFHKSKDKEIRDYSVDIYLWTPRGLFEPSKISEFRRKGRNMYRQKESETSGFLIPTIYMSGEMDFYHAIYEIESWLVSFKVAFIQ